MREENENGLTGKEAKMGCGMLVISFVISLIFSHLYSNDDDVNNSFETGVFCCTLICLLSIVVYLKKRKAYIIRRNKIQEEVNKNPLWREMRKYAHPDPKKLQEKDKDLIKVYYKDVVIWLLRIAAIGALILSIFSGMMERAFASNNVWGILTAFLSSFIHIFLLLTLIGALILLVCGVVLWVTHKIRYIYDKVKKVVKKALEEEWHIFLGVMRNL